MKHLYIQLNFVLIAVIFFLIITILIILRRKKNNISKVDEDKKLKYWYDVLSPLQNKISLLETDKLNSTKKIRKLKQEIDLYTSYIIDFLNMGVWVIDINYETIFSNSWIKNDNMSLNQELKKAIENRDEYLEYKQKNQWYMTTFSYQNDIIIMAIYNIDKIKNLEKKIQQKDKLAYLGKMSATIAHEFKNSLAAIKGFNRALIKKSDNSEFVKKIGKNIDEEIEYFYNILVSYLEYSKEMVINIEWVDIKTLIIDIIENNFYEFKNSFKINIDNIKLNIDKDRIKQVLINIIKNSIEASDKEVEITLSLNENNLIIKDNGKGIDDKIIDNIFNPFFTTKDDGTGLGLSICNNIMIAHNGEMLIESEVNIGTTVILSFSKNSMDK